MNLPETLNIGNSRSMERHSLLVWRRKMLTHLVVAAVVDDAGAVVVVVVAVAVVVAVESEPLIDYVVMIVVNFVPDLMEKNHFVKLETVAGNVVVIENKSFDLSLLDTTWKERKKEENRFLFG